MAEELGPRDAVLARELTKLHEETLSAPLADLAQSVAARDLKGEVVILVGPAAPPVVNDEEITQRLHDALVTMNMKDAVKAVSSELQAPRTRVYALGLKIKDSGV